MVSCSGDSILKKMEHIKEIGDEAPEQAMAMLDSLELEVRDGNEYVQKKYDLLKIRLTDKAMIPHTSDVKIKELVGYFFLRCFFNGKGYRGRMVDNRWNNKGIGKLMSLAINHIALTLGIRMFSSISPENYASLASVKATCNMKVIKTLENGYFYIEILPQKTHPS